MTGQNEVRLSLAGAQDKLPVHVDGEQIFIPIADTPSTYLLKFASPVLERLPIIVRKQIRRTLAALK